MKPALVCAFAFCALFSICSCTKTTNVTTTVRDTTTLITIDTVYEQTHMNPIQGLWVGHYINTGDVDSFYYSIAILPNGTCTTTAIGATINSSAATGPWELNGSAFSATVTILSAATPNPVQAITGTYDSTAGTLKGQWTFTQGPGVPGTFSLTRVP